MAWRPSGLGGGWLREIRGVGRGAGDQELAMSLGFFWCLDLCVVFVCLLFVCLFEWPVFLFQSV